MDGKLGYDDTPYIPGAQYRVHDCERPQPRTVTSGTENAQEAAGAPPSDAVILFDGTDLSKWESINGGPAGWKVENNYMEVVPQSKSIRTKEQIGDCQLHIEWATPTEVRGDGQKRGNSGVFFMEHYEVQVLDCYDNLTYADGTTAANYGQFPPLVNACRKPGEWQTYDIIWIAPRFEGQKLKSPARITVLHNGVLVQNNQALLGPTKHKKAPEYTPHPDKASLMLQDHNQPVRFRNIWYRSLTD